MKTCSAVAGEPCESIHRQQRRTKRPAMYSDSDDEIDPGILGKLPGELIGQGSRGLPLAETATEDLQRVEVDAQWAGRAVITYQRKRMRHGKNSHWSWVAVHAEPVVSG